MEQTAGVLKFFITEILYGTTTGAEGTTFIEGDQALIATLQSLTAEQASTQIIPNTNSVVAHLIHTNAYLQNGINSFLDQGSEIDWPATWHKQSATEDEYQSEITQLKSLAAQFSDLVGTADLSNIWVHVEANANLIHTAYHLGAIRQLASQIKAQA